MRPIEVRRPKCSEELIESYLLGRLGKQDTALIEQHLLVCHGCQAELERTEVFITSARSALMLLESKDLAAIDPETKPVRDQRLHLRIPRKAPVHLFRQLEEKTVEWSNAEMMDLSQGGMGLMCTLPLATGARVILRYGSIVKAAVIRHSSPCQGAYHVGIEFA